MVWFIYCYFYCIYFSMSCPDINTNEYEKGWPWTSNPSLLNRSYTIKLSYGLKSNKTSTIDFLTWILIWKGLVISFSFLGWRLLKFTSFYIVVHTIIFSTLELVSNCLLEFMTSMIFFLASFLWFYGFNFGCNLQHLSSIWLLIL